MKPGITGGNPIAIIDREKPFILWEGTESQAQDAPILDPLWVHLAEKECARLHGKEPVQQKRRTNSYIVDQSADVASPTSLSSACPVVVFVA